MSKFKLYFFAFFCLTAAAINLTGCATTPAGGMSGLYSLNGTVYFSLPAYCDYAKIDWDYDTFSRRAILIRDGHKVHIRVGDGLILVDGRPTHLRHPIDIYQGIIVGPLKFRQEILDEIFSTKKVCDVPETASLNGLKIVVDAGHGGRDPGAIGRSGLREKDVNLDLAKRLGALLKKAGAQIVYTRSSDRYIPLGSRVDIANSSEADFFVSVHANANRVRSMNGFEVYYVSPSVSDSKRAAFAAKNARLKLSSSFFGSNSPQLKAIIWDMLYTNSRAESIELSRSICTSVNEGMGLKILGIKGAKFEVLRGVRMPGVLVEVGFVSNREEEAKLKNGFYRQKIAEAISCGIINYHRDCKMMEASKR